MSRNIIITGGTGFIGSNLVNIFIKDDRVYNLSRNKNEKCENIYWNLRDSIECGNIEDKKFPSNIDTIIHCAAIVGEGNYSKREYMEINTISTLELLEYCVSAGVKQFVYISTGGIYGFGNAPFCEEDQPKPKGIYSISKYFSEELCREYEGKLKITILRVFFPYGKDQKGRLVSNLINKINNGEKIILNYEGMPLLNPIYVVDLCNVIKGIVDKKLEGIYNVCGNEIVSIKELCKIISDTADIKNVLFCFNNKNIENILGNNQKIQSALNYSIKTTISEGIKRIINS